MQNYKSQSVRSPYQPHPIKQAQERAMNMQDERNPARQILQKLCQTPYNLRATFLPDTITMSALKTPGLVAVTCELYLDKRPIGIGHGSTVISRLNKSFDRALYGCLNGALMSAINSACKSLDVIRMEGAVPASSETLGEAYKAPRGEEAQPATDRQKSYLRELILLNCEDDTDRQNRIEQLGELTKEEASQQIQLLAR